MNAQLRFVTVGVILLLLRLADTEAGVMTQPVFYRTIKVDGVAIFYREAGPSDAPVILLLHGLPSSSRMFDPLLQRLSDRFRLIAPDYPGFGHSDWPNPREFAYTFDNCAEGQSSIPGDHPHATPG